MNLMFVLVLLAALFHALWNSIVKASANRLATMAIIQLTGAAAGLVALPFVKFPEPASWTFLLATTIVHLLYQVLLVKAYKLGDLSQVYPIARGSGPMYVTIFSLIYGEYISTMSLVGIITISIGISYLGFYKQLHQFKTVLIALSIGLLIGIYTILDGLGIRHSDAALGYIAILHILIGAPITLVTRVRLGKNWMQAMRSAAVPGLIAGTLATVGYGIALWVAKISPLAYVASLRETSVIIAAGIGAYYFNESFGKHRIIASVIVVGGMILLTLGK